jgi:uncharacterized protein YggE
MPYFGNSPYDSFYDFNSRESDEENLKLRIDGTGSVRVEPDIAVAFLGVVSENKELSIAQQENQEKIDKVVASILNLGIAEKDIKTESFSITPEYDFVEGKQIFRGYRVNNNLRITIRNIKDVGKVIDTAVANGANTVYNVNFGLLNREAAYKKALSLAINNAVSKAKSIERTLTVEVDPIPVEIAEESTDVNIPRGALFALESPAAATTIKSGEIEVLAKINAVFHYKKI